MPFFFILQGWQEGFFMRINVTRSSMPAFEEYCEEIRSLWDSHWLTNDGEKHVALQNALCGYWNVPQVVLFTNGHLALEALIAALELEPGEIITTPFTFASTTHAIVRRGFMPVFADVTEEGVIDPDCVEKLITPRTRAILPVHVYGRLCDVDRLQQMADAHGIPVIYDAAHAFGVTRNGVSAAAFGTASMFSFHATKVFNTIEGGAITTASAEIARKLLLERNFGITGPESVVYAGGNAKMNEFQAAMGLCNLRRISADIAGRKAVHEAYVSQLSGLPLRLPEAQKNVESNYAYFPVFFANRSQRDAVCDALAANDIFARKYVYPLINDFDCYRDLPGYDSALTPVAKRLADCVVTLPMYPDLAMEDVARICRVIREVLIHE